MFNVHSAETAQYIMYLGTHNYEGWKMEFLAFQSNWFYGQYTIYRMYKVYYVATYFLGSKRWMHWFYNDIYILSVNTIISSL